MATNDTVTLEQPTLSGLRGILLDEIRRIREGETTAANANAVTNATGKILSTLVLQMKYAQVTGKPLPDMPLLIED